MRQEIKSSKGRPILFETNKGILHQVEFKEEWAICVWNLADGLPIGLLERMMRNFPQELFSKILPSRLIYETARC
jgi:hypothetical protein